MRAGGKRCWYPPAMLRTLAHATPLLSLLLLAPATGCDGDSNGGDDGGDAGAEDGGEQGGGEEGEGEAPAADRVCTEAYVCSVSCLAGPAAALDACLKGCEDTSDAEAKPLLQAVMTCRDAQCTTPGAPLEPCLLEKCADALGACYDDARKVNVDCPGQTPNEQGIGKACTVQTDCTGLAADNCPYAMDGFTDEQREFLPRWCNHLCERDDECGTGAFCWQRRSVEDAKAGALIGSCAPDACLTD